MEGHAIADRDLPMQRPVMDGQRIIVETVHRP
jgi:hypothetical protein